MKFSGFNTTTKIGIGTDAPTTHLNVTGAHIAARGIVSVESTDHTLINLRAAASGTCGMEYFVGGTQRWGVSCFGSQSNKLRFNSSSQSDAPVLVLQTDGNVGIGTTAPAHALHVYDTTGNASAVLIDGSASNSGFVSFRQAGVEKSYIQYTANSYLRYSAAGGHSFGQNVGIGTAILYAGTNVTSLTINATSYPTISLNIGGTISYVMMGYTTYVNIDAIGNRSIRLRTNDTDRLSIDGSGNATFSGSLKAVTILDTNNSAGTNGQVLTTTGSALDWKTLSEISGVDGSGTANYIPKWTDGDTIGNSIAYNHAYGVVINGTWLTSYATNRQVFEVKGTAGTGAFDGGITNLSASSDTNAHKVGQLAFINAGNANHVNPSAAAGSRIAQIISTVVTSDSNAGDDSGGDLQFWTKPEAGTPAERMRITSDGKVGIGTTNPALANSLQIQNGYCDVVGSYGHIFNNNPSVGMTLVTNFIKFSAYSGFRFFTYDNGSYNQKMHMDNTGKVGIGSIAPIRQLDVLGAVAGQYSAALINTSGTGHGLYIKAAPNSASYMALAVDDKDGVALFNVRGDRRVGINDNSPSYSLDVNGTFRVTGAATFDSSISSTTVLAGNGSAGAPSFSFTSDTNTGMYRGGTDTLSFATAGTNRLSIIADGKVGISSANPATILSLGGSLATGGIYINSGADEDHTIIDMTGITGGGKLIWDDSEEAFSMSKGLRVTAGSVGIGTDAPADTLSIQVPNGTTKGIFFQDGTSSVYGTKLKYEEAGNKFFIEQIESGSQTGIFTIQRANGNVGIGTASPGSLLHVYGGNIKISSTDDKPQLVFGEAAADRWVIGNSNAPNNYFAIGEGSDIALNERLVIAPTTGSVGIGTDAPAQILHVAGGNLSTIRNNMFGVTSNTPQTGGETNVYHNAYYDTVNSREEYLVADEACGIKFINGQINFRTAAAGSADGAITWINAVSILADGKVGIGTTAPLYDLHIKMATGNTDLKLESDSNAGDVRIMLDSANSTRNANITFFNAGTQVGGVGYVASDTMMKMWGSNNPADDHLCIASTGKVGIGTNAPATPLDVNGIITSRDLVNIGAAGVYGQITFLSDRLIVRGSSGKTLSLGTNGAHDKLFMALDGNVGIGTTAPETLTHLYSASDTTLRITAGTSSNALLNFGDSGDTDRAYVNYSNSTDKLYLSALNTRGADITIDGGTGNVGIGTTAPAAPLHVTTNVVADTEIIRIQNLQADTNAWISLYRSGTENGRLSTSYDQLTLQARNNKNVNIFDDSGNGLTVADGGAATFSSTVRAEDRFDLYDGTKVWQIKNVSGTFSLRNGNTGAIPISITNNGAITFTSSDAYTQLKLTSVGTNAPSKLDFDSQGTGRAEILVQGTERISILSDGNVGIGTTSPSTKLSVYTTSVVDGITLDGSTHPAMTFKGAGTIRGYLGIATGAGGFTTGTATGDVTLRSDGGAKLFLGTTSTASTMVLSGYNVGIGTTAPARKLEVYGDTSNWCANFRCPTDGYGVTIGNRLAAGTGYAAHLYWSGGDAGSFTIQPYSYTNSSSRGLVLCPSDGNVGIGTTSPDAKLDVNGDVRIGNSTRGHYLGEKGLTINGTTYTTALTIVLSDHNAAHVKLFLTGDWSGHSAVAYVGEYFIQNGAGGYAEPGMIISEFDNTATDFIESKIVDPSTDTFTIQLKLSDSDNGSLGGHICYHVMGEVTSVT